MEIKATDLEGLKIYRFDQHYGGGKNDIDERLGIGDVTYIEAHSTFEANALAESIGINFSSVRCECCGRDWDRAEDNDAMIAIDLGKNRDELAFLHRYGGEIIRIGRMPQNLPAEEDQEYWQNRRLRVVNR